MVPHGGGGGGGGAVAPLMIWHETYCFCFSEVGTPIPYMVILTFFFVLCFFLFFFLFVCLFFGGRASFFRMEKENVLEFPFPLSDYLRAGSASWNFTSLINYPGTVPVHCRALVEIVYSLIKIIWIPASLLFKELNIFDALWSTCS